MVALWAVVTVSFMVDRIDTPDRGLGVLEASLTPWAVPALVVLLLATAVVAGLARRTAIVIVVIAVALLAVQVDWLAPAFTGAHARGDADLTVMEANLHLGTADAGEVVTAARRERVDVLVLTEITPQELTRLDDAGLTTLLPHRVGKALEKQNGSMVFSRYRLRDTSSIGLRRGGYRATVEAPRPFTIVAAHADQPAYAGFGWSEDLVRLRDVAGGLRGPGMIVGDLNGSTDVRQVRRLMSAGGLADAAQQANSGWQPTWPGRVGTFPATVFGAGAIDHVLVGSAFSAVSTSTIMIDGTDHRALVARLVER